MYEAWPVTYARRARKGRGAWTRWRRGDSIAAAIRGVIRIGIYPTAALLAFAVFSRVVVGQWFVSGDFFVPENKARGLPLVAIKEILWGARELSGHVIIIIGVAGCVALACGRALRPPARQRADRVVTRRDRRGPVGRVCRRPSVSHPLHGAAGRD